jgi:hypothetical protein
MKLAIIGSKYYQPVERVDQYVSTLDKHWVILVGGVKGVDNHAMQAANERGIAVEIIHPEWNKYDDKEAAYRRNRKLIERCNALVAFWDGKSKRTGWMIAEAARQDIPSRIFGAGKGSNYHRHYREK